MMKKSRVLVMLVCVGCGAAPIPIPISLRLSIRLSIWRLFSRICRSQLCPSANLRILLAPDGNAAFPAELRYAGQPPRTDVAMVLADKTSAQAKRLAYGEEMMVADAMCNPKFAKLHPSRIRSASNSRPSAPSAAAPTLASVRARF
jgi:hypothetical protein